MKNVLVLVLYLILGFLLYRFLKNNTFNTTEASNAVFKTSSPVQQIVGGDKDEHGCIGSAGYVWCASKDKCLRLWEEDCN